MGEGRGFRGFPKPLAGFRQLITKGEGGKKTGSGREKREGAGKVGERK